MQGHCCHKKKFLVCMYHIFHNLRTSGLLFRSRCMLTLSWYVVTIFGNTRMRHCGQIVFFLHKDCSIRCIGPTTGNGCVHQCYITCHVTFSCYPALLNELTNWHKTQNVQFPKNESEIFFKQCILS